MIGDNTYAATEPGLPLLAQTASGDVWYRYENTRNLDAEVSLSLRIADEILIAKGAKFREETGRQGRLREKYKS